MSNVNTLEIDVNAVKAWLTKQGLKYADIDGELGYARALQNYINRGRMSKPYYKALVKAYGLPDGSFLPTKAEAPAPVEMPNDELLVEVRRTNELLNVLCCYVQDILAELK